MARLPDIDINPVEGAPPSTATVEPTDLGLGTVGAMLENTAQMGRHVQLLQARAQAKEDADAVRPLAEQQHAANSTAYLEDAARYKGDQPGFTADQIHKAQQRNTDFLNSDATKDLTPGQRAELQHQLAASAVQVGQWAGEHEAKTRAQPIIDQMKAQDAVQLSGGLTSFITAFAPTKQKLLDGYDGSQPGLTQNVGQAFDAAAAQAVAATPARLQGALQERLAGMRAEEIEKAAVTEQHGADAYVLTNSTDQANKLINTVVSNPLAYDSVVSQGLPQIVASLPAGLKKDALTEFTGLAAAARVKGLVDQGNIAQAKAELSDGRYDEVLKPQVKEELVAHVEAAAREHGPKTFDQWVAAHQLEANADAETYARLTTGRSTGRVDLDQIVAQLGPERAADYAEKWKQADQTFAAVGAVRDMATPQLQAQANAAPPDPSDPQYTAKASAYQIQHQAALAELKTRQEDPAAWAMGSKQAVKGAGAAAGAPTQDRGAQLEGLWQTVQQTSGSAQQLAAGQYAGTMLGVQYAAGVAPNARTLVPKTTAAALAASVINAPPEQRLQAMQSVAALVQAFPASFSMPDGSTVSPQAILGRQLLASHLSPVELSAIVDYGADPAKLGRVVAALNDPTLKKALPGAQERTLEAAVRAQIGPYMTSIAPTPGAQQLAQARIDRTVLVARAMMAQQGLGTTAAAQAAAADMAGAYRFSDTWRMPAQLAGQTTMDWTGVHTGLGLARQGSGKMLGELIGQNGANLYAPAGLPGGPDQRRQLYAAQVQKSGRWVTAPDDSGLMLMVPHPDGSWDQVADRFGRPVRATWQQLQSYGQGSASSPFAQPPANAVRGPDGQALPAFSRSEAFGALAWAVNGKESGFRSGLVSPEGALGQMQVTPDTVKTYAPRLGLPVDLERAKTDDDYNRKIGQAALSDMIQRYGSGAGVGLALAAYNAGPGRLEGYRDPKTNTWRPGWLQTIGDPRTGKISLTDFVARIPYKETRDYVQTVLPVALKRLQGAR